MPAEARTYIYSLYEIDKSAARRIIYQHLHARPHTITSADYFNAKDSLVRTALKGVEDQINTASKGFSARIKFKICNVYEDAICRILNEASQINVRKTYWETLRKEIDIRFREHKIV